MSITRIGSGPRMSQAVIHGDTVYLAGQVGTEGADITTQARDALASVEALLAQAGSDKSRILSVTVWLADMADFAAMNEIYAQFFSAPFPARSAVAVKTLPKGALVEIECIAAR